MARQEARGGWRGRTEDGESEPAPHRRGGHFLMPLRLARHRDEMVEEPESHHSCWRLLESDEELAAATARALECERERQALLDARATRYQEALRSLRLRGGTDVPRAS